MNYGFSDGGLGYGMVALKIGSPAKSVAAEPVAESIAVPVSKPEPLTAPAPVQQSVTQTAAMQTPQSTVITGGALPTELNNPPAVVVGTPAPQTASLFSGDTKTVIMIAGALLILGLMRRK